MNFGPLNRFDSFIKKLKSIELYQPCDFIIYTCNEAIVVANESVIIAVTVSDSSVILLCFMKRICNCNYKKRKI